MNRPKWIEYLAIFGMPLLVLLLSFIGCDAGSSPKRSGFGEPGASTPGAGPSESTAEPGEESAATAEPEPLLNGEIVRPAGLTAEEVSAGGIALFDGGTTFGWSGARSREAPKGVLFPIRRQINTNLSGAGFSMPLGEGEFRFEAKRPDGEVAELWFGDEPEPVAPELAFDAEVADPEWTAGVLTWADGTATARVGKAEPKSTAAAAPARFHVGGRAMRAAYRNLRFKPTTEPLPLESFTPTPGSKAETTIGEGELRLKGGLGFLRSERQYGDFLLQFEVKVNAADSNSGLFFRTMEPT
ncbi:MAG: family 16 glycoside hydrolase, partial [Planctomycetota bacterium]